MSQEVTTVFCYNGGKGFEFDIRNADVAEKLEAATEALAATEKNMPKDGKASSYIRYQCQMIKQFFDDCLAPGAGVEICGERDNFSTCMEAYKSFLAMVREQKGDMVNWGNTFRQYSNRQQRRHPQQGGKKPHNPGK